jgi:hypothetical protein
MVIEAAAASAVAALVPYLMEAGKGFAKNAGEKTAEKAGELYDWIKAKIAGDKYAEQTLARVEEQPDNADRQATLKAVVSEKMKADPDFARTLERFVEEIKALGGAPVTASGDRSVAIGRDVSNTTIVTGDKNKIR